MIREKKWLKEAEARAEHDMRPKRDPGSDYQIRSLQARAYIKSAIENLITDHRYAEVEMIALYIAKLKAESEQREGVTK